MRSITTPNLSYPLFKQSGADSPLSDRLDKANYASRLFDDRISSRLTDLLNEALRKTYRKPSFQFNRAGEVIMIDLPDKMVLLVKPAHTHTTGLAKLLRGIGVKQLTNFDQMERDGFVANAKDAASAFGFDFKGSSGMGHAISSFGLDFIDRESGFHIHVVSNPATTQSVSFPDVTTYMRLRTL